ncbi:hypothetical protein N9T93_00230 [Flavobacteriaceae bacterium]|nr:hypothetical protein [Flavobacteriaceae bacterium]
MKKLLILTSFFLGLNNLTSQNFYISRNYEKILKDPCSYNMGKELIKVTVYSSNRYSIETKRACYDDVDFNFGVIKDGVLYQDLEGNPCPAYLMDSCVIGLIDVNRKVIKIYYPTGILELKKGETDQERLAREIREQNLKKERDRINSENDRKKIASYRKSSNNLNSIEKQDALTKLIYSLNFGYPELKEELSKMTSEIDNDKIANYRSLSANLNSIEKQDALAKLLASLKNNYPDLEKELSNINSEIDNEKIANYRTLSINLNSIEKLDAITKLLASLKNNYPELKEELSNMTSEIDNDKIANYRSLSANLNSIEKQDALAKLLASLKNNYPDLEKELSNINFDIDNEILIEKIDLFIKKNDFKSAREFVFKMDKKHQTDEVFFKVFPHYKILKMVYDDIVKAEDYNNIGNNANVYILLYLLNYSSIEFKNAKWFKGAFGTSRLVLMGTDNKLYGGLGWRQAAGLQFKLEKISSSSLPKIKNSLISQVPFLKQKRSGIRTESYVDQDDLTNKEFLFGRKISGYISPNDFYKTLLDQSKTSKGYPSEKNQLLKARYGL